MITIAEIRRGNYVQDRLSWIRVETINRRVKVDYAIDPIPLTADLLTQKCGFKREDELFFIGDNSKGYTLEYVEGSGYFRLDNPTGNMFIESLHALQNDYKDFTHTELEIIP